VLVLLKSDGESDILPPVCRVALPSAQCLWGD
jgi:hypothetical protein